VSHFGSKDGDGAFLLWPFPRRGAGEEDFESSREGAARGGGLKRPFDFDVPEEALLGRPGRADPDDMFRAPPSVLPSRRVPSAVPFAFLFVVGAARGAFCTVTLLMTGFGGGLFPNMVAAVLVMCNLCVREDWEGELWVGYGLAD
jgi:hypothetical protein